MKRMRKLALLLCLLLLLAAGVPAPTLAHAEELRYAVAPDTNVWFYSAESEDTRLFLLPETYYVRVLYSGDTFSVVEYLVNDSPYRKVMGYCRTAALCFVDFIPARPFLRKQITVSYTLSGSGIAPGYEFSSVERTFVYYGNRYDHGQLYFYVLEGDTFGYIPADAPLDFERNDDWLTVPSGPSQSTDDPPMSKEGPSALQIVLLCIVSAAALIAAFLVLRGKKPAPPAESDRGEF